MTTTTIRRAYKFAMAPEHLIFDRRLSDRAVRLFLILDRRAAGRTETFPSRAMLAEDLDCSRESVDRAVRELCATGWLAKERADRGDVNSYVLLEAPRHAGVVTPDDTSDRRRQGREVSSQVTKGVVAPDAQGGEGETGDKNPPAPSEQSPHGGTERPARRERPAVKVPPTFEEWYEAYPLKKGKIAAQKAYVKALRITTHEVLMAAALRFRVDATRDPAFTPHPATWLNAGRWEDEGPAREQSTEVAVRREDAPQADRFAAARARAAEAERRMAEMGDVQ